jgi:hypothetical protein
MTEASSAPSIARFSGEHHHAIPVRDGKMPDESNRRGKHRGGEADAERADTADRESGRAAGRVLL